MDDSLIVCHEKRHRLPVAAYCGRVVAAFTVDTAQRRPFFDDDRIVGIASAALAESFGACGCHVGVYVFMPDHVHLILSGADARSDVRALVIRFKQKTAYRARRQGHAFAWQKDFYDHIIRANEDYGAQVRYLLRNPVRRGLCDRWQDWSHKGVLGQTWEELARHIVTL